MRFLMLNWRDPKNPRAGGAERVAQASLAALAERGHEVYWFGHEYAEARPEEDLGGIHIVRGGGIGTSLLEVIGWYRGQARFDLVIDQHHGIAWYAPWWCGTNCVALIHEVLGPIWEAFYPWPISAIGRRQERWTHWLYRRVPFWTGCEYTKALLHRHGVRDVTVLGYGIHTRPLAELAPKPLTSPLRLAVVCRLAPNKRVDHSLQVAQCLLAAGIDVEIKVVGTGEVASATEQFAERLGLGSRACFTGPLTESEKDRVLRDAHWLLHTSMREGWGLNVIEANAMGTPAAVYPVAGLTESTLHDKTGVVAPAETPQALARSILEVLRRPEEYERYRRAAWERAKQFHWDRVNPTICAWLEQQAQRPALGVRS